MAQRTWADIAQYVTENYQRTTALPNRSRFLSLGNEALALIAAECSPFKTYWDNSVGGSLTLSSATCSLPTDCLEVTGVEWDGDDNYLVRKDEAWMDAEVPGWRSDAGEPTYYVVTGHQLILDSAPTGTTTGKLVVRGYGSLGTFADTETTATTPLRYLPYDLQLAPAYYILSRLLADPGDQYEVMRQADFRAQWEAWLPRCVAAVRRRMYERFTY